ncbi:MAG: AraC family transcriptional regulator [Candidatus Azobacteroides sp.]|nr:AraC family transcriptional regulator [Candidatus Azobacteroides sp.]
MKESTENIYHEKANEVLDYISRNPDKLLKLKELASLANVSQRQLVRIMDSFLEESLYEYIIRQKMERAVIYMQIEHLSLAEIAERTGYNNPQSFSKVFRKQFGLSAKAYINSLHQKIKEQVEKEEKMPDDLPHEIVYTNNLPLVYLRIFGKYGKAAAYHHTWQNLIQFLKDRHSLNRDTRFIGISFNDPNVTCSSGCCFYACASVNENFLSGGKFGKLVLPGGKYAVYTLKGSYAGLQSFYNKIYVRPDYPLRHGAAFEEYLNSPDDTEENDLLTNIFIPIK